MSANGMDDESISKILAMNLEDVKRITGRTATDK
jgi:hypothetical protein